MSVNRPWLMTPGMVFRLPRCNVFNTVLTTEALLPVASLSRVFLGLSVAYRLTLISTVFIGVHGLVGLLNGVF